jgi:glycine betaine/proline transport system ATP-binding protein
MEETDEVPDEVAGDVDQDATLESVIAVSGGDTTLRYRVTRNGAQVGVLHMRTLVRALVPTGGAEGVALAQTDA